MVNIVKKYVRRKSHKLNTLLGTSDDSEPRAENIYTEKNGLLRNNY